MSRTVVAGLLTSFRTASSAEPIRLVSIPTGLTSPSTLRYATTNFAVTWGSQTWSAWPIAPTSRRFDGPGEGGGVTLVLADADGTLAGYVASGATFEGQTITEHLTDLSRTTEAGGDGTGSIPDEYEIQSVSYGDGFFSITAARPTDPFDRKIPRRVMNRTRWPGLAPGPIGA